MEKKYVDRYMEENYFRIGTDKTNYRVVDRDMEAGVLTLQELDKIGRLVPGKTREIDLNVMQGHEITVFGVPQPGWVVGWD